MFTNCGSGTCLLFMKSLTCPPSLPPAPGVEYCINQSAVGVVVVVLLFF